MAGTNVVLTAGTMVVTVLMCFLKVQLWRTQPSHKEDTLEREFRNCTKIFLDLGANRGTHIRKLFEPEKYPDAKYLQIFDRLFGPPTFRQQPSKVTGLCAIGFEANPRWRDTFNSIERAYRDKGWHVIFYRVAVSNRTGKAVFYKNDFNGSNSGWGFSRHRHNRERGRQYWMQGAPPVLVPIRDFGVFLQQLNATAPSGTRLMKMDIEGSEYDVMLELLENGQLCKHTLDMITIEWHPWLFRDRREVLAQDSFLRRTIQESRACASGPQADIWDFDDESYLGDGQPLPRPRL